MRRYGALLLACLVLAGCGNGGAASKYDSAESVASAAGCSDIKTTAPGEVQLFATDEVQCRYGDGFALVDWFKDADSRENWTSASKGSGSYLLVGPNWAITCPDKTSCDAMQAKAGGSIQ